MQEDVGRYSQVLVKGSGYGHSDGPLSCKHLGYLGPTPDEGDKITRCQVRLVHPECDGRDRVGKTDGAVSFFIEFDEVSKDIQFNPVRGIRIVYLPFGTRQRVHEFGYPGQRSVIVLL